MRERGGVRYGYAMRLSLCNPNLTIYSTLIISYYQHTTTLCLYKLQEIVSIKQLQSMPALSAILTKQFGAEKRRHTLPVVHWSCIAMRCVILIRIYLIWHNRSSSFPSLVQNCTGSKRKKDGASSYQTSCTRSISTFLL